MKNLGIFAGGFKPFTTGHFSKLALASEENDLVLLFYGLSSRKKGSDFVYTEEIARKIFDVIKASIERNMPNVKIVEAKPSPIAMVFSTIGHIFLGKEAAYLQEQKIYLEQFSKIKVYTDLNDANENYLKYSGTPKEKLYFGEAISSGDLKFVCENELHFSERALNALNKYSEKSLNKDHVDIRGSQIRSYVSFKNKNLIIDFLPPILTTSEKNEIANILIGF
jgi:nicotinamide mononucleotide adenylyltransferase